VRALFDHVVEGAQTRDLVPILGYAEQIGKQRYESGFEFIEVQSAFNLLEEAVWRAMLAAYPQAELGVALGVVATILGAAKDRLASTYLTLATETHVPSLELGSLFRGTQNTGGGAGEV
jgi:urease accessory protein UreF